MFLMGACVKPKPVYQPSTVGAGFACPKPQNNLFSGERTLPLRTTRQYYPRFDNPNFVYGKIFNQQV